MELFDTHCHLDHDFLKGDLDAVIERARAAGVTHLITPSLSFKNIPTVLALTKKYPECYAGIGIYPRYCAAWQAGDIERVRQAARQPKVVAIGEIGLDYYFNIKASRETQIEVLSNHLALAAELDLPVLLHNRDLRSYTDTLDLIEASPLARRERVGVLHDFTSDYKTARRALDLGLYISFAGPLTYRGAKKLPEVASKLPLDRILIETDSPCVPPEPYRKLKRSEPAQVLAVAETIALIHHKSVEEIVRISFRNACQLFKM